jgi:hypothetical protein
LTAGSKRSIGDRPAQVVFAVLVLACFAAFFLTQRLKHTPTAVQAFKLTPRFTPSSSGAIAQERISFKLAKADAVTVTIIDKQGNIVATLVRDHRLLRYKQFSLRWNGHRGRARSFVLIAGPHGHTSLLPADDGPLAAPGEYRVRVSLSEQARSVLSPRSFTLFAR